MLYPDIVFGSQVTEIAHEFIEISDKRCSHCHRKIVGTIHQSGNRYFDTYCWQFRFINDPVPEGNEKVRDHMIRTTGSDSD